MAYGPAWRLGLAGGGGGGGGGGHSQPCLGLRLGGPWAAAAAALAFAVVVAAALRFTDVTSPKVTAGPVDRKLRGAKGPLLDERRPLLVPATAVATAVASDSPGSLPATSALRPSGRAVQVDPIEPMFQAPKTKRLKLKK
jgi:hypothetical protein